MFDNDMSDSAMFADEFTIERSIQLIAHTRGSITHGSLRRIENVAMGVIMMI